MLALAFLLTSWLPFVLVLPWARRGSPALRLAWIPVIAGALAAVYTAVSFKLWPEANIRVDLLLVAAVVWAAGGVGCAALVGALAAERRAAQASERGPLGERGRRMVVVALVAAAGWLVVIAAGVLLTGLESNRLTQRFTRGQELLLAAKLRDRASAEISYGALTTEDPRLGPWVGVWDLAEPTERVRTLVIADDRRVWLRFACAVADCEAGPGELRAEAAGEARATVRNIGGGEWRLRLAPRPGGELAVAIEPFIVPPAPARSAGSRPLETTARRRELPAAAAPAPPASTELEPLGTFSALEWMPQHVGLTEVQLWRAREAGEDELLGIAIDAVVLPARATMLFPQRFEGVEPAADGSFELPLSRGKARARLVPGGLELARAGDRGIVVLAPGWQVGDPALRLVPSTDRRAWREWTGGAISPVVDWTAPAPPAGSPAPIQ